MKNDLSVNLAGIGRNIRQARKRIGLSLRQLSSGSGVSPSHILRIESGEFDITLGTLIKVCGALGLRHAGVLEYWTDPDLITHYQSAESEKLPEELDDLRKKFKHAYTGSIGEIAGFFSLILRSLNTSLVWPRGIQLGNFQKEALKKCASFADQQKLDLVDRYGIIHELQTAPTETLLKLGILNKEIIMNAVKEWPDVQALRKKKDPETKAIIELNPDFSVLW